MALKIVKAIKLYNKCNKAYKASKKVIDSQKGLSDEVKKTLKCIKGDIETLCALLPEYKEPAIELEEIIKNAF